MESFARAVIVNPPLVKENNLIRSGVIHTGRKEHKNIVLILNNQNATRYPHFTKADLRMICLHSDSILLKLGEKHIAISILNNDSKIARNLVYYTTCCFDNSECINILF